MLRALRSLIAAAFVGAITLHCASAATLLNVSYDPTREFYAEYNLAFAAYWKKKTGEDVTIEQSHGSSGGQSRAVIEGLEADVVTLALAYDIDAIATKSKSIAPDWAKRLPDNSSPYTSSIVFLVRAGNPKHIHDWPDIAKPGVAIVTPNAVVLDSASRASTVTFTERGIGDVLVSWENEAILVVKQHPKDYQIVVPSVSILAEPPVAWVDANVTKHHTEALAKAYLEFLYTPQAQRLACKWGYRPRLTSVLGTCGTSFPRSDLTTIANFGGWNAAAQRFFADGGIFDQVYSAK